MIKLSKIIVFIAFLVPFTLLAQTANFHTIPLPKEVKPMKTGNFVLNAQSVISYPKGDKALHETALLLAQYIKQATGLQLFVTSTTVPQGNIRLSRTLRHTQPEAYNIRVNSELVLIEGASEAGCFYGVQTLRKSLPVGKAVQVTLPSVEVKDFPRFAYRGAHLDVARHFVTADSIYRFIDMLALHGINRFHWHLTDDQGWRIEIKKYPLLTKVGAWRNQTTIGHNSGKYDGKRYGGYYTQKQIKNIVKYAAQRYITIIPEIDMPGHMQAALSAYPDLGCTGGPYNVWQEWGVTDSVLCAGSAKTYEFIGNVLDEVVKLFPSTYIHVGGDECPKTEWKRCAKCQALIAQEQLQADGKHTAEERLQSYFIKYAEKHLNQLGRQMIGWDETLEGGLAPNATVMSWRGEGGGFEAARQHHKVIMTPNTYLYFDYYQSADTKHEPDAIGGYLPLHHVYSYEPMPRGLNDDEKAYIIGVQANLWTEYIPTFRQVEYMELPRMAALSEVQWCLPEQKDYDAFIGRLKRFVTHYDALGYNYARVVFHPSLKLATDTINRSIVATLSTIDNATIHYTLDGSKPTVSSPIYTAPLHIKQACTLRAAAFRSWGVTPEISETFHFNKATACPIRLLQLPHPRQVYGGATLLVDGLTADDTNYASGRWIGFCGNALEAIIDLGSPQLIQTLKLQTCVEKGYWLFDARSIELAGSTDGTHFTPLAHKETEPMKEQQANKIYQHTLKFAPSTVRYVKVKVAAERSIPSWHPGKGNPGFVFVDEICVE